MDDQQSPRFIYIRTPPKVVLPEPPPTKTIFLNSHNLNSNANSNQNIANTATHRSRKEKLICRSIVTTEPAPSPAMEVSPETLPLSRHYSKPYLGIVGGDTSPKESLTGQARSKTPRKNKLNTGIVEERDRNGTCESISSSSALKLPKKIRLDSTNPTNGLITSPIKKSPVKPRKERIPKTPPSEKPKRKYTKRKNADNYVCNYDDKSPTQNHSGLSECNHGDNEWNIQGSPEVPERSPEQQQRPNGTTSGLCPTSRCYLDENCELPESRVPNNNTHLLLSPQTLKRMLRSPSPASQSASIPLVSDDDLDEEIMQASNSLFKDMSLRRGEESGSPPRSSYASSSSTSSSSPQGRTRYSRRKFGRLYPSFDPNHCIHPHCLEGTLTGSKHCAAHAKGHLPQHGSSLYAQCIYTDPFSLKPCKKTVYGEDEREFKFCFVHAERVTATRLRMQRRDENKESDESIESLMEDLESSLAENEPSPPPPASSPTPTLEDGQESSVSTLSPPGLDIKDKEELKYFFSDVDSTLLDQSENLQLFSRFQPDQDSDEDIGENGEDDPLKHAGYYSTDEVISIYRSRLDKLRSLYQSQFSGLKHAYMECRQRCNEDVERNDERKFSFTCDPKFVDVTNSKLPEKYKEDQVESRDKSLALLKYRHRFGPKKVVQLQAMREHEKQTGGSSISRDGELGCEIEDGSVENPYDLGQSLSRIEALKVEKGLGIVDGNDNGSTNSNHVYDRTCIFGTGPNSDSSPCKNLPLPFSNYCKTHILHDCDQMLYGECGRIVGESTDKCTNPVLKGFEKSGCIFHCFAEVSENKPSEEDIQQMNEDCLAFPFAESEEEQDVLEELVAKETFSMTHFDRAVKYLDSKGFDAPDTDESEGGEDEEEDEAFKNLLLQELQTKEPKPKAKPGRKGRRGKKIDDEPIERLRPPLQSDENSPDLGDSSIALRYLPLLPSMTQDEDEPQPTLVLLTTD